MPSEPWKNLVTVTAINMNVRLQLKSDLGEILLTRDSKNLVEAVKILTDYRDMIELQVNSLECKVCECRFNDVDLVMFNHDNLIDETVGAKLYEFTCEGCLAKVRSEQIDEATSTGN